MASPTLAGVETINFTGSKALTIGALTNATAVTAMNFSGAGNVSVTTGALALNVNTVLDAHAVTGTVTLDASGSSANGVALIGSNTAASTLLGNTTHMNTLTAGDGGNTITGGSAVDTITVGNGNNTIAGGGGADVIVAGNGNNTISGFSGGTVTVGNGWNVITGGAGADAITTGTGGNLVTGGGGADTITFGAHVAGVMDGIVLGATDSLTAATNAAMVTAAATSLTGADVITGIQAGDTINLAGMSATFTGALGTTIASATGTTVALVEGTYDTTAHTFTASATGHDSLVVYDQDAAGVATVTAAVVLVGYHGTATAAAGVVTLA